MFFKMEVNRFKYFGTIYMKAFKTCITMCDRVMQEQGESWNRKRCEILNNFKTVFKFLTLDK